MRILGLEPCPALTPGVHAHPTLAVKSTARTAVVWILVFCAGQEWGDIPAGMDVDHEHLAGALRSVHEDRQHAVL